MANRLKMTEKKMWEILDEVSKDANVIRACTACAVSRNAFYDKMRAEPEKWKDEYEKAVDLGTDALIDEGRRRAHQGVRKAIYYNGEIVGFERVYSDSLLMFLVKGRRHEYRDRMIDIPKEGKFSLTINTEGKDDGRTDES
jgi:hypothetical protein